ncbi:MAG: hypothetical protein E2P08_02605 [Acidobacteria bacterium]|nr:MAG: hypothetical protein E2P08_02605 [Acidobacteriota bacterium]
MKLSLVPLLAILTLAFGVFITAKAKKDRSISGAEARSVYFLVLAFAVWTVILIALGIGEIHVVLMDRIPLLWQSGIPVTILFISFILSRNLRRALNGIASSTPQHWLVFFQALRIGALGGVIKGIQGQITSSFVFWVGIPDFLFGVSAILVRWLLLRTAVSQGFLVVWSLIGASIILLPTFLLMNYWMNEPGFVFIFEFPMVLAPGIVVPMMIFFNLLSAWGAFQSKEGQEEASIKNVETHS